MEVLKSSPVIEEVVWLIHSKLIVKKKKKLYNLKVL